MSEEIVLKDKVVTVTSEQIILQEIAEEAQVKELERMQLKNRDLDLYFGTGVIASYSNRSVFCLR